MMRRHCKMGWLFKGQIGSWWSGFHSSQYQTVLLREVGKLGGKR